MIRTLIEIQGDRVSVTVDGEVSSPSELDWAAVRAERDRLREKLGRVEAALEESRELVAFKDKLREEVVQEADGLRAKVRELTAQADRYKDSAYRENERAGQNKEWAERAEANGVRLSAALVEAEKSVYALDRKSLIQGARIVELERALAQSMERKTALETEAAGIDHPEIVALRQKAERVEALLSEAQDRAVTAEQSLEARDSILAEVTRDRDRMAAQIGEVISAVHGPTVRRALRTTWKNWTESQATALTQAVQDTRTAIGSHGVGTTGA